jgi:hypothetical protein
MWKTQDDEADQLFRAQFEEDAGRVLFRLNRRRAPVVVTFEEKERSIEIYRQRVRWVTYGSAAVMMAVVIGFGIWDSDFLDRDGAIFLLVAVWMVPFWVAFKWAWRSSTREFVRRTPVGKERARGEVRSQMLSEWGWMKIASPIGIGLALIAYHLMNWPPESVDNWIWLGFGVVMFLLGSANSIVKLRARSV